MGRRINPVLGATLIASVSLPAFGSAWDPVRIDGPKPPAQLTASGGSSGGPPRSAEVDPPQAPQANAAQADPAPGNPQAQGVISVAVLPFRIIKADPSATGLAESFQQAVIGTLSGAPTVKLYNLQPAGGGKFATMELAIAGARAAGVAAVVLGSYQANATEARVTAGVYQSSGKLLGMANARGNPRDVFALQDDIARQIRDILAPGYKTNPVTPAGPNALIDPNAPAGEFAGIPPVPYEGSSLQRALNGEEAAPGTPRELGDPYIGSGGYIPADYGSGYGYRGYGPGYGGGYGHGGSRGSTGVGGDGSGQNSGVSGSVTVYGPEKDRLSPTGSPYSAGYAENTLSGQAARAAYPNEPRPGNPSNPTPPPSTGTPQEPPRTSPRPQPAPSGGTVGLPPGVGRNPAPAPSPVPQPAPAPTPRPAPAERKGKAAGAVAP